MVPCPKSPRLFNSTVCPRPINKTKGGGVPNPKNKLALFTPQKPFLQLNISPYIGTVDSVYDKMDHAFPFIFMHCK